MNPRPRRALTVLALLCITALAAGLRFYQIDRLPPGLSYDEAWNDLQALRVVQAKFHPVYFMDERRDVEEPFHIYLIAGLFAVTGPQAIGGRLVSAFLGTLTIPLLFLATREMLRAAIPKALSFRDGNDTLALLAAFVLATLYWHVHYTRLGMEPPTVPALGTLTFWLLWRAFNRGRWLDYAVAGCALGLSLYTHPSARFLPLAVSSLVLYRWLGDRTLPHREWPRFGSLVVCAVLVFAPLGLFFIQHPDLFFYRAGQASVITLSGGLAPILDNTLKVIGGLIWRGDTNLRLNLPGRPGLDVAQWFLLAAGVWSAVGRERRRVLSFPILWAGVMVLPSVFSDAAPHFGRMLGATPALAILIGLGANRISIFKLSMPNGAIRIGAVLVVAALGYSTVTMVRDYWVTWARDPGLFTAFDVGMRQSAEYLAGLPREELISLSPVDRNQPLFRFTFRDDVSRLKTFNGRRCLVYPVQPERDWTHVGIVAEESDSLRTLQRIFPSGQVVETFKSLDKPYAVAYRVRQGTRARVPPEEKAVFNLSEKEIVLSYLDVPARIVKVGETLPVTIAWQSHHPLDVSLTFFVHLAPSPDSPPVAQEDAQPCDNSYPTTEWTPGEVIEEYRRIMIPAHAPPGQYVLTTGIYDLATGRRLPVRSADGRLSDHVALGTVTLRP